MKLVKDADNKITEENKVSDKDAEAAFKTAKTIVHTTSTATKAVIYGFDIPEMPARVEETDTGLGHYELSLIMYYRGLDWYEQKNTRISNS